ncbi:MAG: T9SS type A sorting domain-containing protein, partial [candidate division WOR-3 bacterium]
IFYDTTVTEPIGAVSWDFGSRPGEGGEKVATLETGDTVTFHVWIPPKGEIDTQLLYQPYSQYLDWGVFDDDSIGIDSLYDVEGFTDGGWKAFEVILPDTVGGGELFAVGVQFTYSDTVNPNDTIWVDLIHSTDYSGIDIPAEDASVIVSLPKASINKLSYEINANAFVHLAVYNTLGQRVKQIVPGLQSAGNYSVDLDLTPGVYLYKVTANKTGKTAKLIIL